ncbi:MAG TPA: hypothetical protein VLH15_07040 [Dehalococcoidales bacterium]|nr:hypothetical protein [Dehalococcoidales bacterium]
MTFKPTFNPEKSRAFRLPVVPAETKVSEVPSTSFADLVRMLAEGISDAQMSLDRASAQMLVELANTRVDVVRNITETIDKNGNITYTTEKPQNVSLLELGLLPTFYQFSQATVEVAMDLQIVENTTEKTEASGLKTLFANTSNLRSERKLGRDVKISSKLTATLVPVPAPLRIEPARRTETK